MVSFLRILKYPIKKYISYSNNRKFKHFGENSYADDLLKLHGSHNISLGNDVKIGNKTWIAALPLTGADVCELRFEDGSTIGDFNHIYATRSIVFEKNSLTANFVYISDNLHSFEDIDVPIQDQPIKQLKDVVIGEGCWIGEHVSIIGASVGKHSVIGANSVVTHDIPDYCVAVGSPAYIIKRYNFDSCEWEKTDKNGNFIVK